MPDKNTTTDKPKDAKGVESIVLLAINHYRSASAEHFNKLSKEKQIEAGNLKMAGDEVGAAKQRAFSEALKYAADAHKYGIIKS